MPTIEDRIDDVRAVMRSVRAEQLVHCGLGHASALFTVYDVLPAIRVPTLIAWRVTSGAAPTAEHIAGRIPGAERLKRTPEAWQLDRVASS